MRAYNQVGAYYRTWIYSRVWAYYQMLVTVDWRHIAKCGLHQLKAYCRMWAYYRKWAYSQVKAYYQMWAYIQVRVLLPKMGLQSSEGILLKMGILLFYHVSNFCQKLPFWLLNWSNRKDMRFLAPKIWIALIKCHVLYFFITVQFLVDVDTYDRLTK